MFCL
jgi:hypothetical protein